MLAFLSLIGTAAAFVAWFAEAQRASLTELAAWTAASVGLVFVSLWFVIHPRADRAAIVR